jgi:hypothetical protein
MALRAGAPRRFFLIGLTDEGRDAVVESGSPMADNLTRKLISSHLAGGDLEPGREIALRIDQILLHDATGPLCALELEAMGLDAVRAARGRLYRSSPAGGRPP